MSKTQVENQFAKLELTGKPWSKYSDKEQELFHAFMEIVLNKHLTGEENFNQW